MSTIKKEGQKKETLVPVDTFFVKVQKWYQENEKKFNYVSIAVLVLIAIIIYLLVFLAPKRQEKAERAIFKAEQYFAKDSLQTALNGDGVYEGLLDVISEYRCTKTANRAKYMAGVCYLKTGNYSSAIKYLKKFKGKDKLVSVQALGLIGDSYVELNDLSSARKYYKKAVKKNPNDLITPVYMYRLGLICERENRWKEALDNYETLKHQYPTSMEAMNIDKRIEYTRAMAGK